MQEVEVRSAERVEVAFSRVNSSALYVWIAVIDWFYSMESSICSSYSTVLKRYTTKIKDIEKTAQNKPPTRAKKAKKRSWEGSNFQPLD